MIRPFVLTLYKLILVTLLSSTCVQMGRAHETLPTIADLNVEEGLLSLSMRINLEAFLAGINLDEISDTDEAPEAQTYDALRALSGDALAARSVEVEAAFNAAQMLLVDGTPVTMQRSSVTVPEGLGDEVPRISTFVLQADIGLSARSVQIAWPAGRGALVLRQQGVDDPYTGFIAAGRRSDQIALAGGGQRRAWETFIDYIPVGFDHILPKGLDHILFVLGLFFLSSSLRVLLWQVSAFTLAHTVTLALGAMGWVTIPGSVVEPLIAASIVYVAVENIFASGLSPWRPFVIFGFGLLHGLGFASVLGEFGLPAGQFVPALIAFNIGVELGQLTVIALAMVVTWLSVRAANMAQLSEAEAPVRDGAVLSRALSVCGSVLIALIAAYWVVERTLL